ncbi:magnesium transporter [Sulfurimonas lithotrophica]|uniref:Magnesium transporter n=1 Tax=Sulfurimonas lithotrophica TaxID=2590022 RepID=A0A5P8NY89_9BACT|nr:CorA family divalent cation transporter [Sulfurimonas lithotrophica]QFR48405.1 magnesium transporter [Sulfurimonas lithotrophica]
MQNIENLIDSLHLEDLKNQLHPSIFDENDDYDMLIIRIPVIAKELGTKSFGFIITKEKSYFFNKTQNNFEELKSRFEEPYKLLDKNIDKMLKSFINYQDRISEIEELLYENKIKENFMNVWLELKLEILKIERILLKTSNTIENFIDYYEHDETFPINHYMDLHEHIERTMRSATLQLSKLDYLYSFYNAKSNDKMNKMIYILTIISAIFLPLNLIVGFFGMNTSSLPFTGGTSGTLYAVSIMGALVLITAFLVQFWRKKIEK